MYPYSTLTWKLIISIRRTLAVCNGNGLYHFIHKQSKTIIHRITRMHCQDILTPNPCTTIHCSIHPRNTRKPLPNGLGFDYLWRVVQLHNAWFSVKGSWSSRGRRPTSRSSSPACVSPRRRRSWTSSDDVLWRHQVRMNIIVIVYTKLTIGGGGDGGWEQ